MLFKNGVCRSKARLDGKTALVTGSNVGIGKATVEDFYRRGARVIMACRNLDKANEAVNDIKNRNTNASSLGEIAVLHLDLASLASVRRCAREILEREQRLDLLVNNAGVMACPQGKTEDGFETQFGVNHLGHFLFTILLLPLILKSRPARIVNVASMAHEQYTMNFDDINYEKRAYSASGAYRQSKLCNILFTKELARRLKEAGIFDVTVYSLHPGVVKTELVRHMDQSICPGMTCLYAVFMKWWAKDEVQGAQTTIHCAVDEKAANETGLYYIDCRVENPSRQAKRAEDGKKLWDLSMKFCQLENYDPFKNFAINS